MKTTIGGTPFILRAIQRDGQWLAHAEREDNGDPFGIECVGASEAEAIARLTRWLEWQSEHTAALEALQQAERAYHRTIAGSAFANPTEGPTAIEMQKESLDAVEAARIRLDEVRLRKPEV
jgi:phosphoglycolate phosphatase-like HAD superfamily hydrolase